MLRPKLNSTPAWMLGVAMGATILLGGCALTPASRTANDSPHTPVGHLKAACDLESRASKLEAQFNSRSKRTLVSAPKSYRAEGMNLTSSGIEPTTINPTVRYLVMARELRAKAARHRHAALAGQRSLVHGCSEQALRYTTYGGSWFLW